MIALRTAANPGSRIVNTHLHTPLLLTSVSLWYVRSRARFPRLNDICLYPRIRAGFFAGVCAPSNATAHSCDPPLPLDSRVDFGRFPAGTEGLKQLISAYRTAFPDLKVTLDDIFAEGEMVAFRWSVSGTHLGDWLGIPPTANHVTATGITLFRIASGNVIESWTSIDLSPAEEELQWLTQGGGKARRSDISLAESGTSPRSGTS